MENTLKRRISIGLLIALVGFPQISETIYTPALPSVASGLLTSAYLVEATLAIYFLGFAFGVLLWGTISDSTGRRNAMLAGLLIYGLGSLACANVGSIESLLAWRFLQAFGASVGSVITQTMLRDIYTGPERTKLFSVISGALAFSPALGPVIGGFISEFLSWRANFWILVILSIGLFVWSFFRLPETRPTDHVRITKGSLFALMVNMISDKALWGHILLIGATNGIIFGFYQEAPFVFIEQLGMQPSHYGLFGLLIAAATIVAARISYRQSHQRPASSLIQWGTACVLCGGCLYVLTVLTGIFAGAIGLAITIAMLFLIFFGIGLIIPNSLSHALKAYQASAGTAGSLFGGTYYCLIALFTWMMSAMHNGTPLSLPLFVFLLGLMLVAGSRMIRVTMQTQREVN